MIGPSNCRQMSLHFSRAFFPQARLDETLPSSRRTRTVRRRALEPPPPARSAPPPVLPSACLTLLFSLPLLSPRACFAAGLARAGSAAAGQAHSRDSTKTRRRHALGARGHRQGRIWALAEALPPCLARGRRFSMPQLYAAVVSTARPRSQGRGVEDVPPVCGVRRSFDEGVPGHLHRR